MPTQNFRNANNAQGVLLAGIAAGATSVILQSGQGALFPSVFPFPVEIKEIDTALNNYRVLKREIATCTNRSGDTLTITRATEACPADYAATSQTQTAFSFSNPSSTIVTCTWSAGVAEDLRVNKTNREDVQNQTHVYAQDTGSANAYAITLSPAPSAYAAGQCFSFKAANSNTGGSTLNVNGLGVKTIVKNGSTSLVSGDITANQIEVVMYDGTNFQLVSPTPPSIPLDTFVLAEGCAAGDALTTERYVPALICDTQINFGNATATQFQAVRVVGNGIAMTTIFAGLKKIGAPADNCIIAIQADSAGSPSGTDLATATIAGGTITTSAAEYNPTLSGSVTPTDKTYFWVVFRRSGALDAGNYYQLCMSNDDTIAYPYKTNNAGAWGGNTLTETHSVFWAWFYTQLAIRARANVAKFARIRLFAPSALSALASVTRTINDVYSGLTGLRPGRQYYLSSAAGAISLTAGTIKVGAGVAESGTSIKIFDVGVPVSLSASVWSDTSGDFYSTPIWIERRCTATLIASGASGFNAWGTGYLQWSTDGGTWNNYNVSSGSSGATWSGPYVLTHVHGGVYVRIRLNVSNARGTATAEIFT